MISRRTFLGAAAVLPLASHAAVPGFPRKVVRIVVPFSPGGSADACARILSEQLSAIWNQSVIVENRPGAGTTVAAAYVSRSNPDGYTLYLAYVLAYASSASVYTQLPYDPASALIPVSLVADAPFVLAVNPALSVSTVPELVALARKAPVELTYASTGSGAGPHLTTEMFLRRAGFQATHVPYRGTAEALAAVVGNQVSFGVFDAAALGVLRSGRLHPLAVTSVERWLALPGVPTIAESGYPDFDVSSRSGIMVSAGTPPAIVGMLQRAVQQAMAEPLVRQRFTDLGFVPMSSSAEAFGELLAREAVRIRELTRELGLRVE